MERSWQQYEDVSGLLRAWNQGDEDAFNRLFPVVYDELRKRAHSYLRRERSDHTLQTTALVHETYVRLADQHAANWENRAQFFWLASVTMRRILVDYAKAKNRSKRGGDVARISIDTVAEVAGQSRGLDLIDLDEALTALELFDRQQAMVVQLRYFAGCSIEETAEVLSVSITTVKRDWAVAKAWLKRRLTSET